MPPPADPWSSPASGPEQGPGHGRRRWPVALALVSAVVLTAVVATIVVLASRPQPVPTAASPAGTASTPTEPAPAPGSPQPATPSPSPTPTAANATTTSPTAAPRDPLPTATTEPTVPPGPDRSLRTNTLYTIDLAQDVGSCDLTVRRPKPPLPNKKLQPYLSDVAACLTRVFKAPLAARGFTLAEPRMKTYHSTIDSPCGDFDQNGSPAYYCSTTRTIYWPDTVDDGREAYTFARLGYVGLTAHEFGHHLQATTGMLNGYAAAYDKASKTGRYALSRRLELQAQCFEGVFLHVERTQLHVTAKDRAELKAWHSYTGDEDPPKGRKPDHGSSKAQFAWLVRGLDSGDFGSCNTWTASAKSVT